MTNPPEALILAQTISELKRDYRLLWETEIGPSLLGDPVLLENRLVSVGRGVGREIPIVGLDLQTGAMAWRYQAERFVASVAAVYDRRSFVFHVTVFSRPTPMPLYTVSIS